MLSSETGTLSYPQQRDFLQEQMEKVQGPTATHDTGRESKLEASVWSFPSEIGKFWGRMGGNL